jgi:hypothetical protein
MSTCAMLIYTLRNYIITHITVNNTVDANGKFDKQILTNLQINYLFRKRQLFNSFAHCKVVPKLPLSLQLGSQAKERILLAVIMPFIIF